jgi:hypothetical protein
VTVVWRPQDEPEIVISWLGSPNREPCAVPDCHTAVAPEPTYWWATMPAGGGLQGVRLVFLCARHRWLALMEAADGDGWSAPRCGFTGCQSTATVTHALPLAALLLLTPLCGLHDAAIPVHNHGSDRAVWLGLDPSDYSDVWGGD